MRTFLWFKHKWYQRIPPLRTRNSCSKGPDIPPWELLLFQKWLKSQENSSQKHHKRISLAEGARGINGGGNYNNNKTIATQKFEANVIKSATSLEIIEVSELKLQTKWLCVIALPNPCVAKKQGGRGRDLQQLLRNRGNTLKWTGSLNLQTGQLPNNKNFFWILGSGLFLQ